MVMRKYKIIGPDGTNRKDSQTSSYSKISMIGPYEVRDAGTHTYTLVCPPRMRKGGSWNFTNYILSQNGNLEPLDDDVILDPYHMGLLYELHQKGTKK